MNWQQRRLTRKRKEKALATLAKYRGRFKVEKFNREDCYDRL